MSQFSVEPAGYFSRRAETMSWRDIVAVFGPVLSGNP